MLPIDSEGGEGPLSTGARLLVVGDHADNRELLAILLGERYRVSTCESAVEALRALEVAQPDLLILDTGRAPVDAVQCLGAIRAVPGYAAVPAIAVTACARDVEQAMFLHGGFQTVLTKPILDYDALFATIDTLVESTVIRRETQALLASLDADGQTRHDSSREHSAGSSGRIA